jgi:hypothetical protein
MTLTQNIFLSLYGIFGWLGKVGKAVAQSSGHQDPLIHVEIAWMISSEPGSTTSRFLYPSLLQKYYP